MADEPDNDNDQEEDAPPLLEELRADLKRNMEEAKEALLDDLAGKHLRDVVWPFLEAMVDKMEEVLEDHGEVLDDIVEAQGPALDEDTGKKLIACIALGGELALALKSRLKDDDPADKILLKKFNQYAALSKELVPLIEQITVEGM